MGNGSLKRVCWDDESVCGLSFVALDFETATADLASICQIGLCVVDDGEIVRERSWLVRPAGNRYDDVNVAIHGISPAMTVRSASFKDVWADLEPCINGKRVVAHNAAFDMACLAWALEDAGLGRPGFEIYDSLALSRTVLVKGVDVESHQLGVLCDYFGIDVGKPHDAASDARACALVFLALLKTAGVGANSIKSVAWHDDFREYRQGSRVFARGRENQQNKKDGASANE